MMKSGKLMMVVLMVTCCLTVAGQGPLAEGQDKFLGCAWSSGQNTNFAKYWNQVTPENGGKWGSAEYSRDIMNWSEMDAAFNLSENNGYVFKTHTMIWGNQQPSWIESLDTASQRQEIEEWYLSVATRFPDIDFIDVVNEPLHAPPSGEGHGNYMNALGGSGITGWDWIIRSFRMARFYFPNAKLLINEYSVTNSMTSALNYRHIINLLKAENLIDGIGIQAHAFSTRGISATTINACLDTLAKTGLPIYISEMDIDGETDLIQLKEYQRVFPLFWEHPAVKGITMWGFRYGLWRTEQGAYLVNQNGTERPAFNWLKAFVNDTLTLTQSVNVNENDENDTIYIGQTLAMSASLLPANTTIKNVTWSVTPASMATIGSNGILTPLTTGKVTVKATAWDNGKFGTKEITILRLVDSVKISPAGDKDSIILNETLAFQLSVYPSNATNKGVTWEVIPSGLAQITANGILTALAEGIVTVIATAKDGSASADSFEVALITLRLVESVEISPVDGRDSINLNETLAFQVAVYPSNATNTGVTWEVIPSGLAQITVNGILTALAEGVVTVIATAKDGSASADSFEVALLNPAVLSLTDAESIRIFPNPAVGGKFTIETAVNVSGIVITDLYGHIVRQYSDCRSAVEVDLNDHSGVFIIRITDRNRSVSRKIIIE